MVNGFFLGGAAEGIQSAREAQIKEDEVQTRRQALEQTYGRAANAHGDKLVKENLDVIRNIVMEGRKAGAPPEKLRSLITPMIDSLTPVLTKLGRDPTTTFQEVDALLGLPTATTVAGPSTEIGKLRQDLQSGFITPDEFNARSARLTRENDPNAIEGIRRKIAAGQQLSVGEKQVYDDALRADPIAQLLAASLGNVPKPVAPAPAAPAMPQAAPSPAANVQGARRAPDGKLYIPDPKRPGKYLQVVE